MTADDDDLDDASMKSMRAVWLSMRDEEPPAAGMSGLLAAAREKADAMREQPAWWQRAFAMLRRPPALAFATVLLLIGGAVLVTRTNEHEVDSMVTDDRARELQMKSEDAPVGGQEAPAVAVPTAPEERVDREEQTLATEKVAAPKPPAKKHVAKPAEVRPEPTPADPFEADAPKTGATNRLDGNGETAGTTLETPGRVTSKPALSKDVAPRDEAATQVPKTPATEPTAGIAPGGGSNLEQLARQAESAATRGDCPAVKTIIARIKQQAESFYRTRLAKNASVTKCL